MPPTTPAMLPTTPARATHDYERNGTCDLFAALEIATGKVPAELDVRVILDNLSPHKTPAVHN